MEIFRDIQVFEMTTPPNSIDSQLFTIRDTISRARNGEKGLRFSEKETGELGALYKEINLLLDEIDQKYQAWYVPKEAARMFDVLPFELVIVDPELKYRYINPTAIKDDEVRSWLIGKTDFDYCAYRNKDIKIAEVRQQKFKDAIEKGTRTRMYEMMVDAQGNQLHYIRSIDPHFDADGNLLMLIGSSFSINELKEKEQELIASNELLTKTKNELDQFVYRASHDLRSPLVSIMGLLNLIRMENPAPKVTEYLGMVDRSIYKLDSFIREIVNHSKNSRQGIDLELIDPQEEIDAAMAELHYLVEGRNIDVQIDLKLGSPWVSDRFRSQIILKNLISNALKYQNQTLKEGLVKIMVDVDAEESRITVEDNGIGIPNEYQNDVFKMFFRATNQSFGAGIGLYIVKEALNRVQGTIQLESTLSKGSRFTAVIPNYDLRKVTQ